MPRIRSTLTVLSFSLCLLLCGLWARSYWVAYSITYYAPSGNDWSADVMRGTAMVGYDGMGPGSGAVSLELSAPQRIDWGEEYSDALSAMGFGGSSMTRREYCWFPMWFPALLTVLTPAWWAWKRRKAKVRGFEVGTVA